MSTDEVSARQRRWWDEVEFVDEFLAKPHERADDDEVCCRVCGEPVTGTAAGLRGHLGAAHEMSLPEYETMYPGAPLEAPEPGPNVDWAGGDAADGLDPDTASH